MSHVTPADVRAPACFDCTATNFSAATLSGDDGEDGGGVPATWECGGPTCKNRPLCDDHASYHQKRKHPLTSLLRSVGRVIAVGPHALCTVDGHASDLGGALLFYCLTCSRPVCSVCTVMGHPRGAHVVESLSEAVSKLTPDLSGRIDAFRTAEARLRAFGVHEIAKAVSQLTACRDAALLHVEAAGAAVIDKVQQEVATLSRSVNDDYDKKVAALTEQQSRVLGCAAELDIVATYATTALESSNPACIALATISSKDSEAVMGTSRVLDVDTTLEFHLTATPTVVRLGTVWTRGVDMAKSSLTADPCTSGSVHGRIAAGSVTVVAGLEATATVKCFGSDGLPFDLNARDLVAFLSLSQNATNGGSSDSESESRPVLAAGDRAGHADAAGAGAGSSSVPVPGSTSSESDSPTGIGRVVLSQQARGVFRIGYQVTHASATQAHLHVRVATGSCATGSGAPLKGSPLNLVVHQTRCQWEAGSGSGMSIVGATATGTGWVRTEQQQCTALTRRTISVIGDAKGVNAGWLVIAVGSPESMVNYQYQSNTGMSFWYDTYYGSVNTNYGSHGSYTRSQSQWTPKIDLIISGTTLTFSVNGSMQSGSWAVPNPFRVFAYAVHAGEVKVSAVDS